MSVIRKNYHLSVCISGFLKRYKRKSLKGMFFDNGVPLSDKQAREYLNECLAKGWTVIPMCKSSECPNFDYFGGGCPGHSIKEKGDKK